MSRNLIGALLLLGLVALVLIFTSGSTSIGLPMIGSLSARTSIVVLSFTGIGVIIGALFK